MRMTDDVLFRRILLKSSTPIGSACYCTVSESAGLSTSYELGRGDACKDAFSRVELELSA